MTIDQESNSVSICRFDAALFHDHLAQEDEPLSEVSDIVQSDRGASLLDRLESAADALYLCDGTIFEEVELRGEPLEQPARPLDWEFWNGQGWSSLDVDLDSHDLMHAHAGMTFRWKPPSDWQSLDQGADSLPRGNPQFWVRARLAQPAIPSPPRRTTRIPLVAAGGALLVAAVALVIVSWRARKYGVFLRG
jgi:hypothetical protein